MTAAPVLRAASAGAARRLVQSAVIFAVLAASSAAALIGLTLLTSADEGFYASFAAAHGADLAVTINASKVTSAQLAKTGHLHGVTQAAGPYPEATITIGGGSGPSGGHGHGARSGHGRAQAQPSGHTPAAGRSSGSSARSVQLTVVGRASPTGPLNHIDANPNVMDALTHGRSRWPAHPGEISLNVQPGTRLSLGAKLSAASAPGTPRLTVVGYGASPGPDADAWVTPGEIPVLRSVGAPAREQMLYTFTHAATTAQINADLAELKAALPAGAVASWGSWLPFAQLTSAEQSVNTPFVIAFAVLALVLAVLIVANVVSAAVVAAYRRIGVLKSIGFTPAQVTGSYLVQIGVSALAGAAAGTALGNWWVLPTLNYDGGPFAAVGVPLWINITVPLSMLGLAGLAALLPAVRAGRMSAVAAIAAGQAPRAGRGYAPHRLAGRIPLPRPVTFGLAAPFSRPARSAVTLAALAFGLAGVVLAAGLNASIHKINHSSVEGLGQVLAGISGSKYGTMTPSQDKTVLAALRAQPGTLRYVAETDLTYIPQSSLPAGAGRVPQARATAASVTVTVAGHPKLPLAVYAYNGDSAWLGWNLISGRWYHGPGEVDASAQLLAETGLKIGDHLTLTVNGKPVSTRIAGEVFVPTPRPTLFTSWQTLGGAAVGLAVGHYDIALKPGTGTASYISALARVLGPRGAYPPTGQSVAANIDTSLFRLLALLVAALAVLGVLNSVLMATRERVHDLGVFKAVGMTPRQTIAMVICWAAAPAIVAAIIALPTGLITQDVITRNLAADAGMVLPGSFVHVLGIADLAVAALAGLAIAAAGALGPATWAAVTKTATALRAE